MTVEEQAKVFIEAEGWHVAEGPFLNSVLLQHGLHVVTIKSVLSKSDLEARKIKWDKKCPPGTQRNVRFLCTVTLAGEVTDINHITSAQRKQLGRLANNHKSRQTSGAARRTQNVRH